MDLQQILTKENLVYRGKSKEVYSIPGGKYAGKYALLFTDRATGYIGPDGEPVFDPGRDVVVGSIPGKGAIACKFATWFFELLDKKGIKSHFIDSPADHVMIVEPAKPLGLAPQSPEFEGAAPLENLEFTWRNQATGSFWRRYPFMRPCARLDILVEAWTKGDSDTLITFESLEQVGVMTKAEISYAVEMVKEIAATVTQAFADKGLHCLDGKFELGRLNDGQIVLIDEISPDVLRVCKGYLPDENGHCTVYHECIKTRLKDGQRSIKAKNQQSADELRRIFVEV